MRRLARSYTEEGSRLSLQLIKVVHLIRTVELAFVFLRSGHGTPDSTVMNIQFRGLRTPLPLAPYDLR